MPREKKPIEPPRQLMIKTKTCQRMQKEVAAYEKEVVDNTAKLNAMEADEADPYDIKRFKEVLAESVMMVPDSKNRLGKAVEDLEVRLRLPQACRKQGKPSFRSAALTLVCSI